MVNDVGDDLTYTIQFSQISKLKRGKKKRKKKLVNVK